jgi:CheY-like chemotaxis protein
MSAGRPGATPTPCRFADVFLTGFTGRSQGPGQTNQRQDLSDEPMAVSRRTRRAETRPGRVTGVSDDTTPEPLRILVYSDDSDTRAQVILGLGRRPHPDLPEAEYVEVATEPVVLQQMDGGKVDLAILDGEAVPAGGLGIAKQMKDEIYRCPPILVLTGRPQDAWLATWSRADAAVPHPIDPLQLAEAVLRLLRASTAQAS